MTKKQKNKSHGQSTTPSKMKHLLPSEERYNHFWLKQTH